MKAQVENFERRHALKRQRTCDANSEEDDDEDSDKASSSGVDAVSEEILVERTVEDMEKQQLQMCFLELEKKLKELTIEKEDLQKPYDDLKSQTSFKAKALMHDDKKSSIILESHCSQC